jgi:tyrosyl-tRNA synthetase
MKNVDEQLALIARGTEQIVPIDDLRRKLERSIATGKPLRVKFGIDPTSVDVHLGHTVPLRKLRQFQQLGHHAVLIIGNYTALVGDPSGRDQTRARLTQEQVETNARDYLKQIEKIIDINKTEVRYNGEWFGKYTFLDVLSLTSKITVQQMLAREDFANRVAAKTEIRLHECLYPLMQGYDSVAIQADVEIGGTDQLFNFMVARDLQIDAGQIPQVCITFPILRGTSGDGKRMGKSLNNYVGVGEPAREQFGKTMRIPDEQMAEWFTLLTDRPSEEIARLTDAGQTHPMEAKKTLGADIVGFYYGEEGAATARREFETQFSQRQDPDEIAETTIPASECPDGKVIAAKLLVLSQLAKSNNEARRKISEGAFNFGPDRQKVTDATEAIPVANGLVIRLGRQIRRLVIG